MTEKRSESIAAAGSADVVRRAGDLARRAGIALAPGLEEAAVCLVDAAAPGGARAALERALATGARVLCLVPASDAAQRAELLAAGAADVVEPAVSDDELLWRVRRALAVVEEADAERRLFQAVIDALPLSLHAIDRDFRVAVWNRTREEGPFGRPRGEVLDTDLFSVIGTDEDLRREYEQVFDSGVARVSEVEGRSGKPPRIFRVEKVPMRSGEGTEITHVITIGHDVTEERKLERAMAQTEKMAAIGRLTAGIAHEINNPLATVAGCAEAMRSRLGGELTETDRTEMEEDALVIEEEAYRCKAILQNLLDFSRAQPEARSFCDPARIVERAARLLRHNPKISGLSLEVETDESLPAVVASEDHLVQVLLALLVNAADATGPEGRVRVEARCGTSGEVRLAVVDDGPGIPPEVQGRVFEPFFTTKPPGQGTGLGLAVAYGLVQAHKGRLEMSSELGHGTRFEVVLPACPAVAAEVAP